MAEFIKSILLLLVLLNPFLVVIYLIDIIQKLDSKRFRNVLIRAGFIAAAVFVCFSILGTAVFSSFFQVDFASFQIFGGIVFLLIGIQFVFKGPDAIEVLRGESEHIAGAVAMPVLIGPGTISASVVIGERHNLVIGSLAVLAATVLCIATIYILKRVHDYVRTRREALIQRYIEIAGRITALFVGTVAIEMIFQGLKSWIAKMII
ncbi:MAG: MarC family protein [Spirochaetes bacterium]|nr:MarC family protein [Spirochaetota bacterium]MBN2769568.1 MarC family protein [Spirochaetota bacterium]